LSRYTDRRCPLPTSTGASCGQRRLSLASRSKPRRLGRIFSRSSPSLPPQIPVLIIRAMPADRWANYQFTVPPLPSGFTDHLVSSPHGVELGVRIWPPVDTPDRHHAPPPSPRPWVLCVHGGSTVVGTPYSVPPWVVPGFTSRGYYVVSAGYRLCPHVGLGDSLSDCLEALAWCRAHLNEVFGPGAVDIARWAVGGESAGAIIDLDGHPSPSSAPSCARSLWPHHLLP
jgi:acetyl esterase/lipase